MKLSKSTLITVAASPAGTVIGDQAQIRGKKILSLVGLVGNHPDGRSLAPIASTFITLATTGGQGIHEDLPLTLFVPGTNGGLVQELGGDPIDWTKSSVKATPAGVVAFSVIYE